MTSNTTTTVTGGSSSTEEGARGGFSDDVGDTNSNNDVVKVVKVKRVRKSRNRGGIGAFSVKRHGEARLTTDEEGALSGFTAHERTSGADEEHDNGRESERDLGTDASDGEVSVDQSSGASETY